MKITKIINIITGFIFGLAPLAGSLLLGLGIYASMPNWIGIVLIIILGIVSIWIGTTIYKKVQIVGPLDFITTPQTSPDLNSLEPTKYSKNQLKTPKEFINHLENNENNFVSGTIRVYGDWFGRPYDKKHTIESAKFDETSNLLTLSFKEGEKLEIHNPVQIFDTSTFFKVTKADRIKLTWTKQDENRRNDELFFADYKLEANKITTDTNASQFKQHFDTSLGNPALMIYV